MEHNNHEHWLSLIVLLSDPRGHLLCEGVGFDSTKIK